MVSYKEKVKLDLSQATQGNHTYKNARLRSFTVYSENDTVKVDNNLSKPMINKKGSTMDLTNHAKADVKYVEKKDKSTGSLTKTMRRPLADVGNIRPNTSTENVLHDGSKPMKRKTDKRVSLQGLMGRRSKIDNVLSRKSLGKAQINSNKPIDDLKTADKVIVKGLKTCSSDRSTKVHGHNGDFSCAKSKRTAKVSLISSRRSLPVFNRANTENATNSKEIAESSDKIKDKVGLPVGRKAILNESKPRSYLQRSRASDGFIMMGQANVATRALSRKSIKPMLKTAIKASDALKTSKIKNVGTTKTSSVKTLLSKTGVATASSLSKNTADEAILGDVPVEKTHDLNPRTSAGIISKTKTGRRRSYTSLLMTGSKMVEEYRSASKQDKLPTIDNEHDQLEVAEYVEEIYQYYWVVEAGSPSLESYLSNQTDIAPQMRGILINWLNEVHLKFDLMHETLFLTIALFDQYLSQVITKKDDLQLVGLTALLLASKYEDFWHPRVTDLISISAELYTREQMLEMETLILKKLKFRLNIPTPYVFMLRFLKAAQSNTKLDHLAFYLIELCLVEYEALKFKPSLLCASAIYLARCTLKLSPSWTPLLSKHTHYEVSHLRDCAEMILKFQISSKLGRLMVTYEKYTKPDFSSVAAVKPLAVLPS